MSSSFQSKDILIAGRQLEAQSVCSVINAVAGTSDLPSRVTIDNSTIAATVVTVDLGETVDKCFLADLRVRSTGAILAIAAAPTVSTTTIAVTFNGTGQTSLCLSLTYKIAE